MVNVEYIAQHVAEYIFVKLSKHVDMDVGYQRRIMEKAVTSACDLYRVCKGVTRKGGRCSRHVAGDAEYCFQHRGATMASDNPRHRSSAEKESSEEESSGSEEESSEDESSASDEDSSEEDTEDESSASEEDTEDDASASGEEDSEGESSGEASDEEGSSGASSDEEESEEESSGESSDEEVPPPKKTKKTKKYRAIVEEEPSPALPLQQKGTPLVREFVEDKDRLACAFLEAIRDVSREVAREVEREASSNPDIPKDEDAIYRWLTVEAITVIKQINNTGEIMHDTVDRIGADLSKGRYERIDLDRLAEQISHNLDMDA
jgi:hypothetical protein